MSNQGQNNYDHFMLSTLLEYEDEAKLIPVTSIDGPAYVIDNFQSDTNLDGSKYTEVIAIRPIDDWENIYNDPNTHYKYNE